MTYVLNALQIIILTRKEYAVRSNPNAKHSIDMLEFVKAAIKDFRSSMELVWLRISLMDKIEDAGTGKMEYVWNVRSDGILELIMFVSLLMIIVEFGLKQDCANNVIMDINMLIMYVLGIRIKYH